MKRHFENLTDRVGRAVQHWWLLMLVGGVIDLLLGFLMCVYPGVTMAILPILLGIWMMYHAFVIISFGGDRSVYRHRTPCAGTASVLGVHGSPQYP